MNRSARVALAEETVAIVWRGTYRSASGRDVDVAEAVRACLEATRFFASRKLERIRWEVLGTQEGGLPTVFEVVNETTLAGIARLTADGEGPVAALNFASAKNPGGGFLGGSQAQEESLARSSALYASLSRAPEYYEPHRTSKSLLYSDSMILSPNCPIFRDDDGRLLDEPTAATFITSAAPNLGAMVSRGRSEESAVPETFRRRSEYVLALAASQGCRRLVLGAWGCGVFRNDPDLVAEAFAEHLLRGRWVGRFDRVVFSVLDASPSGPTMAAFRRAFGA